MSPRAFSRNPLSTSAFRFGSPAVCCASRYGRFLVTAPLTETQLQLLPFLPPFYLVKPRNFARFFASLSQILVHADPFLAQVHRFCAQVLCSLRTPSPFLTQAARALDCKRSSGRIGSLRTRFPVAAKMALAIAGAIGGTGGSPRPSRARAGAAVARSLRRRRERLRRPAKERAGRQGDRPIAPAPVRR